MFFRFKKEIKAEVPVDKVILNFALDTRSFLNRIQHNIYSFFSEFGDLKGAKIYDTVALSQKLSNNPDYIRLLIASPSLSKEEKSDLQTYNDIISSIQQASKIYIMGHCVEGRDYLISDSKVKTPATIIKYFFPTDMRNKNIDIIACESNAFTEYLTEDLKNETKSNLINCNGLLLSSKTFITIPLPSGECYYLKMNDSGLPEIFKTGHSYRKDFFIVNDDVISLDISEENDINNFQVLVEKYRNIKPRI